MSCGIEFIKWLSESGRLPRRGRLLDIGESCLLAATPADISSLLGRHGCRLGPAARDAAAEEFAYRSNLAGHPTIPTLFLGDVFRGTEVEYVSFAAAPARVAEGFDLNVHALAPEKRGRFDLVLNFGATKTLVNQYNAFKVMHDACAAGGHLFHQLPATGYINHGYFGYDARVFGDLAEANGYEVADLWFYGPSGAGSVLSNADRFPGVLDPRKLQNNVDGFRAAAVPNSLINVLFRKVRGDEFRVGPAAAARPAYTSPYIARPADPAGPGVTAVRPAPARRRSAARAVRRLVGRALRKLGVRAPV